MMYDVAIIGGGPAGLALLSALHNREGTLTDMQQADHFRRLRQRGGKKAPREALKVAVVDPAGAFMVEWKGRFDALDIGMLRSPAWAHPDFFSSGSDGALCSYAWTAGRSGELRPPGDLSQSSLKHLGELNSGQFHLPSSALFADFCDGLAASLPHAMIAGEATAVAKEEDGAYAVAVAGDPLHLLVEP